MVKTFFIKTLGCKTNQIESAIISEILVNSGYIEVDDIKKADFYILNSCSVTHIADSKNLSYLRRAKQENPNIKTVLTGCMAQLQKEKILKLGGGLYHETQIKLTYNSNHIEGSKLTEDQTRYIFETKTLGELPANIQLDDVIETNNHFRCIDYVIDHATAALTETLITNLQYLLKEGTEHSKLYGAGQYKVAPNTVGGIETTPPEDVAKEMKKLLAWYNSLKKVTFENIVEFHYRFETIHPFQDGNGRIGRLIAFKECLKNNIVPFYIDDANKWLYYRGLKEWNNERNYLIETCRFGQDQYKMLLDYFKIKY